MHVYDGHIHESDYNIRKEICDNAFDLMIQLKNTIENLGIKIKTIVAGGTPTFPIQCTKGKYRSESGTPLLWDQGYSDAYKDLKFLPAAILLTRIVSKPKANYICFDLGHKSVASEMALPRVKILNFDNSRQISPK